MDECNDFGIDTEAYDDEVSYPPIVENDGPVVLAPPVRESEDTRPAAVRIADLFESLPGCRGVLLAVIEACGAQQPEQDVMNLVGSLQEKHHSVYSGLAFCKMLEKAGALQHVRKNGDSYDEGSLQPKIVIENGDEYLLPVEPPESFWRSTAEGLAYAAADNPGLRAKAVVDEEPQYASIYKFILERCSEGATPGSALSDVINAHPTTRKPRMDAMHFIKRLEDAGAIVWDGTWTLADKARESLDWLDSIEQLEY